MPYQWASGKFDARRGQARTPKARYADEKIPRGTSVLRVTCCLVASRYHLEEPEQCAEVDAVRDTNSQHRIVTWNCHHAQATSELWSYLLELEPDIALLQEVGNFPETVARVYNIQLASPRRRNGQPQSFQTALLVRGTVTGSLVLSASLEAVTNALEYFTGNLPACSVELLDGTRLKTVCVYCPAWRIDDLPQFKGVDLSSIKLPHGRGVWVSDLLRAWLTDFHPDPQEQWVIGGDFNSSETFDHRREGDRGNREGLDRIGSVGLVECLRCAQGDLTPTFQNTYGGAIVHQMDHLFVSSRMRPNLVRCETGSQERVFGLHLSDHLPIIADFER